LTKRLLMRTQINGRELGSSADGRAPKEGELKQLEASVVDWRYQQALAVSSDRHVLARQDPLGVVLPSAEPALTGIAEQVLPQTLLPDSWSIAWIRARDEERVSFVVDCAVQEFRDDVGPPKHCRCQAKRTLGEPGATHLTRHFFVWPVEHRGSREGSAVDDAASADLVSRVSLFYGAYPRQRFTGDIRQALA
jgi:hypothetical protein